MKTFFTFFCCLIIGYTAVADKTTDNAPPDRISTDNRVPKNGRYINEYLLSVGLQGGANIGDDIGVTNPFFGGLNLEFEKVFKRRWSLGIKLNPKFNLGTTESLTYTIPNPISSSKPYKYTQDYEYSSYVAIPISVSGKYYFQPFFVRPYVGLDAGVAILVGNIDGAQFVNTSDNPLEVDMVFTATPRLGIIFDIRQNLHWGFNVFCNFATGSQINGESITELGLTTAGSRVFPTPIWTSYTKQLGLAISPGVEVSLIFSF